MYVCMYVHTYVRMYVHMYVARVVVMSKSDVCIHFVYCALHLSALANMRMISV